MIGLTNFDGLLIEDSPGDGLEFNLMQTPTVDTGPGEIPDGATEPKNVDAGAPQSQNLADPGPQKKQPINDQSFKFEIAGFNGFIVLGLLAALIAFINTQK